MNAVELFPEQKPLLNPLQASVLHTLLYFDIFNYPLLTDEVHHNCQWNTCTISECATALEQLQEFGLVEEKNGYWFLFGKNQNIEIRHKGELRTSDFLKKAKKYASLIGSFPFVKGVYISGSLSKGIVDRKGDIDYFIITQPGRLWLARTLLVLFKKIILFNSRKYFCVNYFIDTNHLQIPDRNLFVATEIMHILPIVNGDLYSHFMEENKWANLFYPNKNRKETSNAIAEKNNWLKRNLERILNGKFGDWLDARFLRLTLNRWKKKFTAVPENHFEVDFRSRPHVSKHHPQGFQRRVALELEKRREEIQSKTGYKIPLMRWEWFSEKKESASV
jgi:hypothetical protein